MAMAMAMLMGMAWSCCSSDDSDEQDVPVTGTPIAFSAKEGEETAVNNGGAGARMMTRATSLHDMNVNAFKVWGFKNTDDNYTEYQTVFPGYTVNYSTGLTASNSSGWEYVEQQTGSDPEQTIKYWDWSAKAYRFFAVTGAAGNYEAYGANGANGIYFTFTADASTAATPYYSRLWFSTGNTTDYPTRQFGKPVQLEFMQPFARVRFMFTYAYEAEGVKLKDPSFKPTDDSGIDLKGTFTVTYPLTGSAEQESYEVTPASPRVTLTAFTEEYIPEGTEKWYAVLPIATNVTQGSYTLTVTINGHDKSCVVPEAYMQWRPGYSYTYIFKVNEDGGVEIDLVQAAFKPWVEQSSDDYEVYNW